MDKFIDNIVSKPRRKIKEFVAFVKDKYFAPEGEEVDNEDFIRRWNGAYEILNVQDQCPELSVLYLLWRFLLINFNKPSYSCDKNTMQYCHSDRTTTKIPFGAD